MSDPLTNTLRLTQPTVGGDSGAWGSLLNSDLAYIDQGVNQILAISVNGLTTLTLEAAGDSGDQARYQWYNFTGTLAGTCTVTVPANQKIGIVTNSTTGSHNIVLTTGGGSNLTIGAGQTFAWYCDGTNCGILPWSTNGVFPAIAVTGNTTLTVAETGSYIEVTSGNPLTIILPTPVSNAGLWYHIYNSVTGTTTLSSGSGNFGGPIGSGTTSQTMVTNTDVTVISDGTTWKVFGVQGGNGSFANLSASGTLNVTGTSSFTGNGTFANNLFVVGTLSAGNVQASSTSTTLSVSGLSTFGGTATFSSAIQVLGTSTLGVVNAGALSATSINNSGTTTSAVQSVTGTSTLNGSVTLGNSLTAAGVINVNGAGTSTFGNNISVGGEVFQGTSSVSGTSTTAVLSVTGTSTLNGAVTMGASLKVTGTATAAVQAITGTSSITGNAFFAGNTIVTGTATSAVLSVTGTSSQAGAAIFGGATTVAGLATFNGTATFNSAVNIGGPISATVNTVHFGTITVDNGVTLSGTASAAALSVSGTSTVNAGMTVGGGALNASQNEAIYARGASAQTLTPSGGITRLNTWTTAYDRTGNGNFVATGTAGGIFTAGSSGLYHVDFAYCVGNVLPNGAQAFAQVNFTHSGTASYAGGGDGRGLMVSNGVIAFLQPRFGQTFNMSAGDSLAFQSSISGTATATLQNDPTLNYISITQVP